ncbi:ergothioneine biosynthesis protein EgtB [Kangiella shandongensis]|uniref:ergothioneine biosynthesis protein EgtB n=1 Tax=Kangiella shandongensis TaxID=2763258 RepID=UPI001CBDA86F|nr:ergothioneine biosynthesis protein EgtB [Kangiella shandongensis]
MLDQTTTASHLESVQTQFETVRAFTESLCEPLEVDDFGLQAMAETSPVKWHLAHTSWFFETFILKRYERGFKPYNPQYEYLFNSYYNAVGQQFPRPQRHLLSRPTVSEVFEYRQFITSKIVNLLKSLTSEQYDEALSLVVLGINHEQQHQELLLTDLKYNLYQNPLMPHYRKTNDDNVSLYRKPVEHDWLRFQPGLAVIGKDVEADVNSEFGFDNESPQHQHYLNGFELGNRLVTNAEYMEFIEHGGYECSEFWLSDGWDVRQQKQWHAPLYWFKDGGLWYHYTLAGVKPVNDDDPLAHVSYYEADAFASWKGARLPTEQEWEVAARNQPVKGRFVDAYYLKPVQATEADDKLLQLYGELWQWTSSSYSPYPGYKPLAGAVGEYNGKFMANQFVLKGGSCATSKDHIRSTYRNFFYPEARWQFSGIRLARDL